MRRMRSRWVIDRVETAHDPSASTPEPRSGSETGQGFAVDGGDEQAAITVVGQVDLRPAPQRTRDAGTQAAIRFLLQSTFSIITIYVIMLS